MKESLDRQFSPTSQPGGAIIVDEQSTSPHQRRFFPGFVRSLTKPKIKADSPSPDRLATCFQSNFSGCMDLHAEPEVVSAYLDRHQDWFTRCAAPMQVDPMGEHGYVLTIGRYGSFGYELEPKIGVKLLPQDSGVYRLETIELPDAHPDYKIDFHAEMRLNEDHTAQAQQRARQVKALGRSITHVEWTLALGVQVYFPAFIHRLPMSLVQRTGTRILNQVVQRVSKSLTAKVQKDFHKSLDIPVKAKGKSG